MSSTPNSPSSATLQPPRKSVEIEDPGAHELETSETEEDVFSDANEGAHPRVENLPSTPGGSPIPKTVIEKVDPLSPSHGEIPGTDAYNMRAQDAVPDVILQVPGPQIHPADLSESPNSPGGLPIPKTVVTKVDSTPRHGEVPHTEAYHIRKGDAEPDLVEEKGDVAGLPTSSLSRSPNPNAIRRRSNIESISPIAADGGFGPMEHDDVQDEAVDGFGEDFDDFEAGAVDDDFGDFDDGFQEPQIPDEQDVVVEEPEALQQSPAVLSSLSPFPLLDYSELQNLHDIIKATNPYLDELFPSTKEEDPPPSGSFPDSTSIFLTERSLSLWSQLVDPPPLQPPNWLRSRIRRLFLVSLGVPVDLDEILPASKQKKLILPSTQFRSNSPTLLESRQNGFSTKLKQDNTSSASLDQTLAVKSGRRRKGPLPAPELDLGTTKLLCATTHAALLNLTDEELKTHVTRLEELTIKASEVLEYWLKRKDNTLGDKEAFEGVIENLVKHARRVRK